MKHKSRRGSACLRVVLSDGLPAVALSLPPPSRVRYFVPAQGQRRDVTMATISVSGEYRAPGLVGNHRAFKSSQPRDLTVARREEEFTTLRTKKKTERKGRRDQKNQCDNRR